MLCQSCIYEMILPNCAVLWGNQCSPGAWRDPYDSPGQMLWSSLWRPSTEVSVVHCSSLGVVVLRVSCLWWICQLENHTGTLDTDELLASEIKPKWPVQIASWLHSGVLYHYTCCSRCGTFVLVSCYYDRVTHVLCHFALSPAHSQQIVQWLEWLRFTVLDYLQRNTVTSKGYCCLACLRPYLVPLMRNIAQLF